MKKLLLLLFFVAPMFASSQVISKIHSLLSMTADTLFVTDDVDGRFILHSYLDSIPYKKVVKKTKVGNAVAISWETYEIKKGKNKKPGHIIMVDWICEKPEPVSRLQ